MTIHINSEQASAFKRYFEAPAVLLYSRVHVNVRVQSEAREPAS
jgi:hypothetical protein